VLVLPFPPNPLPFEMPETSKSRVLRQQKQKERTDERIRQLRRKRRDNIIRETVD
jgi:hypothetical protein